MFKHRLFMLPLVVLCVGPAIAQPWGGEWFSADSGTPAYVQVPDHTRLDVSGPITFEAWVSLGTAGPGTSGCRSIAGKGYLSAWSVWVCGSTLRSYRSGVAFNGGTVPGVGFVHVAAVIGGGRRKHYVNGELVLDVVDVGGVGVNGLPLRLWSDPQWAVSPRGLLFEVRLWKGERSLAKIRRFLTKNSVTGEAGLIGRWSLDGTAAALPASLNGTVLGDALFDAVHSGGSECFPTASSACLFARYNVSATFRSGPIGSAASSATVRASSNQSVALSTNLADLWEILVNIADLCGTGGRPTVAVSSPSNYFRHILIYDNQTTRFTRYFLYPGAVSLPVIDSESLWGCPTGL